MPRSPRIEFPGAMDHVLARGNRQEPIVFGDDDRWMFLRTLGEMAGRTEIRVHAYALMDMMSKWPDGSWRRAWNARALRRQTWQACPRTTSGRP